MIQKRINVKMLPEMVQEERLYQRLSILPSSWLVVHHLEKIGLFFIHFSPTFLAFLMHRHIWMIAQIVWHVWLLLFKAIWYEFLWLGAISNHLPPEQSLSVMFADCIYLFTFSSLSPFDIRLFPPVFSYPHNECPQPESLGYDSKYLLSCKFISDDLPGTTLEKERQM